MFREVRRHIELTALDTNGDNVHDLRVILRRIEEAETPRDRSGSKSPLKKTRRALRDIFHAAGAVRDHDVLAELLAKSDRSDPELDARLAREREQAAGTLRELLTGSAIRTELTALPERRPTDSSVPNTSAEYLTGLAKEFFRRGRAAHKNAKPEKVHRFRIAGKRLRYALERLGVSGDQVLAQLGELQSTLGRVNDCRVALRLLDSAAPKALRRWLKRRQHKYIARFQAIWPAIKPRKKDWLRVLAA